MNIRFHRAFKKQFAKAPKTIQMQFQTRLTLFIEDPAHPLLHRHSLRGTMRPLWSINISGDYRALYIEDDTGVVFQAIGTHSQLYS